MQAMLAELQAKRKPLEPTTTGTTATTTTPPGSAPAKAPAPLPAKLPPPPFGKAPANPMMGGGGMAGLMAELQAKKAPVESAPSPAPAPKPAAAAPAGGMAGLMAELQAKKAPVESAPSPAPAPKPAAAAPAGGMAGLMAELQAKKAPVESAPSPAPAPKPETIPLEGVIHHRQRAQPQPQPQIPQPDLATTTAPQHRSPAAGKDVGPVFTDISALRASYALSDESATAVTAAAALSGATVSRTAGGGFVVASAPFHPPATASTTATASPALPSFSFHSSAPAPAPAVSPPPGVRPTQHQHQQHDHHDATTVPPPPPPPAQHQQQQHTSLFHAAHSPQSMRQHINNLQQQQILPSYSSPQQQQQYHQTPPRGPIRHLSSHGRDAASVASMVPPVIDPTWLAATDGLPLALHAAFSPQDIEKLRALLASGDEAGAASPASPKAIEARKKIVELLGELTRIEEQHGAHSSRPTFDSTPSQLSFTELAVEVARAGDAFFGWLRRATMYSQGELARHCEDAYAAAAGAISASCQPSSDIVLDSNQRSAMRQILTSWRLMWVRARGEDEAALEERARELQGRWFAVQGSEVAEQTHLGNVYLDQLRLLVSEAAALMPVPSRDPALAAVNCSLAEHRRAVLTRMEAEASPRLRLDPEVNLMATSSPGASWLRVHGDNNNNNSEGSPFSPPSSPARRMQGDVVGGQYVYSASLNEALAFRRGLDRALTSNLNNSPLGGGYGSPAAGGMMSAAQRAASRPWR